MTVSARFVQLSSTLGSPAAAARALRFPVNTFVRIASGLPVRAGSLALAEKCLTEYDAQTMLAGSSRPIAISTVPAAGDLPVG